MASQNNPKTSNFWFGFSLGIVSISALIYLFGTEKGRKTLKKLLDLTENLEDTINLLTEELTGTTIFKEEKKEGNKKTISSVNSLLDKMKILSPLLEKKQVKKFFVKEGKLLESKK